MQPMTVSSPWKCREAQTEEDRVMKNRHWYRVIGLLGTRRAEFTMFMDPKDDSDVRTAKEVAGNMLQSNDVVVSFERM